MNPDNVLHDHWIYQLPDGKNLEALKGEDGHWRLWQVVWLCYGDPSGEQAYTDYIGAKRINSHEVTESGNILYPWKTIACTLDDIQDTGYTLDFPSGAWIPREKVLDELISMAGKHESQRGGEEFKKLGEYEKLRAPEEAPEEESERPWWHKPFIEKLSLPFKYP